MVDYLKYSPIFHSPSVTKINEYALQADEKMKTDFQACIRANQRPLGVNRAVESVFEGFRAQKCSEPIKLDITF